MSEGGLPIKVVLADDQPMVRAGIAMLLSAQPDIEVTAEVSDGAEAVAAAETLHPDIIVMDLRMPGLDGIEATRAITADNAERPDHLVKVLALTTFDDDDMVYGALRAGAQGFLLKHAAPSDLVAAIRRVAAGDAWIDPMVAGKVISALSRYPQSGSSNATIEQLTPREREVLALIAEGMSNTEISQRLVLSEATVKTHVSRILMRTGCRDRAQAVVLAFRSGLVSPS